MAVVKITVRRNGPFRVEIQPLEQFGGFHSDGNACTIVDRASAEIPRVQVTGNDHNLLGILQALEVPNDVVALHRGSEMGWQ